MVGVGVLLVAHWKFIICVLLSTTYQRMVGLEDNNSLVLFWSGMGIDLHFI